MIKNEHNCLLSIIIPVYNVEKYLEKALSSVADQTLDKRHFEVIVIDDASEDTSLKITRCFEAQHPNFRVISLSENTPGGSGTASNIGIRQARGKYIGFVDSDDWVEPSMFERMLARAEQENAELVICDFKEFDQLRSEIGNSYDRDLFEAVAEDSFFKQCDLKQKKALLKLSPVPWRKLYLRSFLLKNEVCYPEGAFFFEDNPLHWFCILLAEKISVLPGAFIVHRKNREGQTMCSDGKEMLAFIEHGKTIKAFLQSQGCYEDFKYDFLYWLIIQNQWILSKMDPAMTAIFIRDVGRLLSDFSRSDLVDYFHRYPQGPVCINHLMTIIKGRSFIYSRLHLGFFHFLSTIHTIFYIYGKRHGSMVIREQSISRLIRGKNI